VSPFQWWSNRKARPSWCSRRGVSRATGRSVQGVLAHFIRFRDGKIVELREFMDSLHAAEQALGRELIDGF